VRYVIIGAGAIGGSLGALLDETGRDVVLVARGAHLRALRETGLRFATPAGVSTQMVTAIGGPDELHLQPDDVLVLGVKSQDTEAALAAWAGRPVAGGGVAADRLPLICAQNGVENERVALRRFAQVYGMSVLLPSSYLEPGLVTAVSDPVVGVLMLGRYPDGVDAVAEKIAAELSLPRLVTTPVPEPIRPIRSFELTARAPSAPGRRRSLARARGRSRARRPVALPDRRASAAARETSRER
jgi:2-dehydropantoate 2-reductase